MTIPDDGVLRLRLSVPALLRLQVVNDHGTDVQINITSEVNGALRLVVQDGDARLAHLRVTRGPSGVD